MRILHPYLSLFIILLLSFLYSVPLYASNRSESELLRKADSLFAEKEYDKSAEYFEKILKQDNKSVSALNGLGAVSIIKSDWGEAKDLYKKILEINPEHLEARYYLGIAYRETGKFKALLLRKWDWDKSGDYFESVVTRDSSFYDVLYQYAILLRYREKYHEAIHLLHRQLQLRPDIIHPAIQIFRFYRYYISHTGLDSALSWLHQQPSDYARFATGEKLRREGDFEKADSIFRKLLDDSTEIPVQPILLARIRILVQTGRDVQADSLYRKAIRMIEDPVDAGLMLEDIKYLLTDQELSQYNQLENVPDYREFFRDFWIRRNPLPSADMNLRLVEHFRRLGYAEKYYEYDGFRGWFMNPDELNRLSYPATYQLNAEFNDKGLIYIRHGKPDETAVTTGMDVPVNESWLYYRTSSTPQMTFHFITGKPGNDWRFAPLINNRAMLEDRLTWGNIYYQLMTADPMDRLALEEEMVQASRKSVSTALTTDRHTWKENTQPLNIPLSVESFRGKNGQTNMEISYALPAEPFSPDGDIVNKDSMVVYERGLRILDKQFTEKYHDLGRVKIPQENDTEYVDIYRVELPPDTYLVAFHGKPLGSNLLGGYKFLYEADNYYRKNLQSSTIQLSGHITPVSENNRFVKNNLEIIPRPSHNFSRNNPVYIYFEIYHLQLNPQQQSLYTIRYRLKNLDSGGKNLFNLFGLLGGSQKSISIESERTGSEESPAEYLALDVRNLEPGQYELQLTITDEYAGTSVKRQTKLTLY